MKIGEPGYFVEFPGQSVFRVTAAEGKVMSVVPQSSDDSAEAPRQEQLDGTMTQAWLHVVSEDVSCTQSVLCSLSGTKLTFAEEYDECQKLIADQLLAGSISVPAFFDLATTRHMAAAGDRNEQLPYYAVAARASSGASGTRKRLVAGLAALVLAGAVGFLWLQQHLTISNTSSLVTSDYKLVASPVTGTVVFVNDDKTITAGEPIFGIEGTSGRPVIVNAPISTANFEAVASPGARVERGKALGRIADENAAPQLVTYVPFSEAIAIAKGAVAQVNFRDNSVFFLPLGLDDIHQPVNDKDTSDPLMKVQVQLPDDFRNLVGQTASIQIRRNDTFYQSICGLAGAVPSLTTWCGPAEDKAT
jgi:hypothetical protein